MSREDRLSEVLRSVKAPTASPDFAAGVLERLLTREAEPERRRELVRALGASLHKVETGVAYTFEVAIGGGRAVALPDTAESKGPSRGSLRVVSRDSGRGRTEREALVGVGYTFSLDDLEGGRV